MRHDYTSMTVWELQQELLAIKTELDRREGPWNFKEDPRLPPEIFEVHSAGKIYRFKITTEGSAVRLS